MSHSTPLENVNYILLCKKIRIFLHNYQNILASRIYVYKTLHLLLLLVFLRSISCMMDAHVIEDEIESFEDDDGATQVLDDEPTLVLESQEGAHHGVATAANSDDIDGSSDTQILSECEESGTPIAVAQAQNQLDGALGWDMVPRAIGRSGDGDQVVADSDATTVDEEAGAVADCKPDPATSGHQPGKGSEARELVQPTFILDTQRNPTSGTSGNDTEVNKGGAENRGVHSSKEIVPTVKTRNVASLRAEALRNSALKAYDRLLARLKVNPKEADDGSAKLLLKWGAEQQSIKSKDGVLLDQVARKEASVVEENLTDLNGEASCSAAFVAVTPTTQPSNNAPAMWSNNKKSTTQADQQLDAASAQKAIDEPQNTLHRVRKVLFGEGKALNECHGERLDVIVATVEDCHGEKQDIIVPDTDEAVQEEDMPNQVHSTGRELSYLKSEEPGEESQANALDMINKLLWFHSTDLSQEVEAEAKEHEGAIDKITLEPLPEAKKPHLLSNIAKLRKESAAVFDWVNSQEDASALENQEVPVNMVDANKSNEKHEEQNADDGAVQNRDEEKPMNTQKAQKPKPEVNARRKSGTVTKQTSVTPSSTRRKRGSPGDTPATGKKRKSSAVPNGVDAVQASTPQAMAVDTHQMVFAAEPAANTSPVTPKDASGRAAVTPITNSRSTRKRKEDQNALTENLIMADIPRRCKRRPVRILFSHSLDKDTIEQQKKIMKKLNIHSATKASECTHFVTDRFARTGNMLEVLAAGKPVVTMAWLESCRVAGCLVDEKNFILEDTKKEKELGFCMLTTFSTAQQKLLLEGLRVYITPNTKPEALGAIVNAAGGKVIDRYDDSDEDSLVISCEEDHKLCIPLLNQGVKIYSTEFLFSGIVSYHLDFSKNLLFSDDQTEK